MNPQNDDWVGTMQITTKQIALCYQDFEITLYFEALIPSSY
jgi:hypothetical protein